MNAAKTTVAFNGMCPSKERECIYFFACSKRKIGTGRQRTRREGNVTGRNGKEEVQSQSERACFYALSSGEVFESTALFDDRLDKLLEDAVHVSPLSRPQALEETDVASVTGDEKGQVGILLHSLHWNGCRQNKT